MFFCLAAACGVFFWGGCGGDASQLRMSLESPDPSVRALAIVRATDQGDQSIVPFLVDRLEDEDAAVRFYAILGLEELTGDRLGYHYMDSEAKRRASVERWRRFLVESWRHADRKAEGG
ncbi:MAG: HEAT repeat domain-containing protein [Phycisphaerae bacterium]|nr:HEAT repeat domain-containing protein [Phycisphaerae bacterium]